MASPADARAMVRRATACRPVGRHLRTMKHSVRLDLVAKMAGVHRVGERPAPATEEGNCKLAMVYSGL